MTTISSIFYPKNLPWHYLKTVCLTGLQQWRRQKSSIRVCLTKEPSALPSFWVIVLTMSLLQVAPSLRCFPHTFDNLLMDMCSIILASLPYTPNPTQERLKRSHKYWLYICLTCPCIFPFNWQCGS